MMPDFELGKFQRVQIWSLKYYVHFRTQMEYNWKKKRNKWINENKNFLNLIIQGNDLTWVALLVY